MKFFAITSIALLFSSCAYSVHQYHVSDMDTDFSKGTEVGSETEQFVVLGFAGNTDFADQAWTDLQAQCPSGEISGINTRHSTDLGFFSWTNRVIMKGYCFK